MSLHDVRDLYLYTEWANERMLSAVRELSDEQYTRQLTSSFPSIRDTFAHIAFAEWLWLERWKGNNPTAQPAWSIAPAVDVLERELRAVAHERCQFLETLDGLTLQQPLSYRNMKGEPFTSPLIGILFHVVNHSTYHRGQLTTMLRQVGAVPPATDQIVYLREETPVRAPGYPTPH